MRFRSTNPVYGRMNKMNPDYAGTYEAATYRGVAGKTIYFILIVLIGAIAGVLLLENQPILLFRLLLVSGIVSFLSSLIAFIFPSATKISGTIYCLFEGLLVGVISFLFEIVVPGAVPIAILGTIAVVLVSSTLFLTGIVRVTNRFIKFLLIFTISIFITYLFAFILSNFSETIRYSLLTPGVSTFVSLIMIFIATLYIMLDLESIHQIVEGGYHKDMEWFAAFGLAFTVIWLYMEILPLVARILSSRR